MTDWTNWSNSTWVPWVVNEGKNTAGFPDKELGKEGKVSEAVDNLLSRDDNFTHPNNEEYFRASFQYIKNQVIANDSDIIKLLVKDSNFLESLIIEWELEFVYEVLFKCYNLSENKKYINYPSFSIEAKNKFIDYILNSIIPYTLYMKEDILMENMSFIFSLDYAFLNSDKWNDEGLFWELDFLLDDEKYNYLNDWMTVKESSSPDDLRYNYISLVKTRKKALELIPELDTGTLEEEFIAPDIDKPSEESIENSYNANVFLLFVSSLNKLWYKATMNWDYNKASVIYNDILEEYIDKFLITHKYLAWDPRILEQVYLSNLNKSNLYLYYLRNKLKENVWKDGYSSSISYIKYISWDNFEEVKEFLKKLHPSFTISGKVLESIHNWLSRDNNKPLSSVLLNKFKVYVNKFYCSSLSSDEIIFWDKKLIIDLLVNLYYLISEKDNDYKIRDWNISIALFPKDKNLDVKRWVIERELYKWDFWFVDILISYTKKWWEIAVLSTEILIDYVLEWQLSKQEVIYINNKINELSNKDMNFWLQYNMAFLNEAIFNYLGNLDKKEKSEQYYD